MYSAVSGSEGAIKMLVFHGMNAALIEIKTYPPTRYPLEAVINS